jgi:cell division septation protein DedD
LFRFEVDEQPPEGWGVQVGAFGNYGNVLVQVEKLKKQFQQPVIVKIIERSGRTLYKIVVGSFDNYEQARRLNERVKAELGISSFPVNLAKLG